MKKIELVYRKILEEALEKKNRSFTQSELSSSLNISLSTVNLAINHLEKMGAVKIKVRSLEIISPKKILLYWASVRNVEKDIIYKTRSEFSVPEIEKNMPNNIIYAAYSAYKLKFKDMPADYSEVYIYSDNLEEIKKRFKENKMLRIFSY